MTGLLLVDCHPSDMRVPPTFFIRGFILDMPSSSSHLSVSGINFLENVWRCVKVVSLFPSAVPFPMCTVDCPIRVVVTRVFRKRGSSTTEGLRPHLIIVSLQHSSNSAWLGCFVRIVCPLPRQWWFVSVTFHLGTYSGLNCQETGCPSLFPF